MMNTSRPLQLESPEQLSMRPATDVVAHDTEAEPKGTTPLDLGQVPEIQRPIYTAPKAAPPVPQCPF